MTDGWTHDYSFPIPANPGRIFTVVTIVHAGFTRAVDFSDYPFGWDHFMSEMAKVAVSLEE